MPSSLGLKHSIPLTVFVNFPKKDLLLKHFNGSNFKKHLWFNFLLVVIVSISGLCFWLHRKKKVILTLKVESLAEIKFDPGFWVIGE